MTMTRTEVNVTTGEVTEIELTQEEIDAFEPAPAPRPVDKVQQLLDHFAVVIKDLAGKADASKEIKDLATAVAVDAAVREVVDVDKSQEVNP